MSAVNVFGSPIDKKKYTKFAKGTGNFGLGTYQVNSLKFQPVVIVLEVSNGLTLMRAVYWVDPYIYGAETGGKVFNNVAQMLRQDASGFGVSYGTRVNYPFNGGFDFSLEMGGTNFVSWTAYGV